MFCITILTPTGTGVGLASVSLGVIRTMERKGVRLDVFRSVARPRTGGNASDRTTTIVRASSSTTTTAKPLRMSYVEGLLPSNQEDVLIEEIVADYHANTKDVEVVLIEGLIPTRKHQLARSLNYEVARTLNAEIVFVMSQGADTPEQLKERIELTHNSLDGAKNTNITDVIVNKLNASVDGQGRARPDLSEAFDNSPKAKVNNVDPAKLQESSPLPVLDAVPRSFDLIATRTINITHHLSAIIINEGDIDTRRAKSVTFCIRSIPHILEHLRAGFLLVTSVDRPDVPVAACLAAMSGIEIGAPLLTDDYEMGARISKLCKRAFATGLPVFIVDTNIWQTSLSLQSFNLEVPVGDHEHIEKVQEYVASYVNADQIESLTATSERGRRLSSPVFRYQLAEPAYKAGKHIVLPEGDEPRTVKAAVIYAECGIIACALLGNPAEISRVTASQGVKLDAGTETIDPEVVRENYVGRLIELRKSKGMAEIVVREQLEDNVVLGTLMLKQDEVDGLVFGVVHTTANTIRPPLQLIRTTPGGPLVSSVFFMLLPEQIYIYGDYAISLGPTAEQLVEIATQSADSAAAFSVEPRVTMLSYSTGTSSTGNDVEKVRGATRLAQEKRPGPMIDGPLQYDAAVMANVTKSGAPNSPVTGRATVSIFPDLNTGNTAYKTVQRSANLISVGPMLQGMRKLVNDLSRGVLVDDIVYTIAPTAIQSAQRQ